MPFGCASVGRLSSSHLRTAAVRAMKSARTLSWLSVAGPLYGWHFLQRVILPEVWLVRYSFFSCPHTLPEMPVT